jgi:hypothetical protein
MSLRLASAALLIVAVCLPLFADDSTSTTPGKSVEAKSAVDKSAKAQPTAVKRAPAKPSAVKPAPPLSAEREAVALAFAREHHPELAALIDKLRHDNRRDYERALRELSQASERLTQLKKQSAERYELSLAAWKLDSRSQLLAARMTVSQSPALEAELKQLLSERADVRLKEYQFERARLVDRLTKLNASIQAIETDKNAVVDKDLQRIKRSVARSRRPAKKLTTKPSPAIASKAGVTEPPRPPAVPTAASVTPPADTSAGSRAADKQH